MLLSPVYLSNHAMTNCLYQENKSNDWLFTFTMVNIIRQFAILPLCFDVKIADIFEESLSMSTTFDNEAQG